MKRLRKNTKLIILKKLNNISFFTDKVNKTECINILTLALGISLLPPLWAVASPYFGINTGAVALICAGIYVANGNKMEDATRISLGFLCGDVWTCFALKFMNVVDINPNAKLFSTLCIFGATAVIIGCLLNRWIYLPAWLCGWAIGLTIMAPIGINELGNLPVQIGVAMIAGVWYVGVGVDKFQKTLIKLLKKQE